MIKIIEGDLFDSDAEIICHQVNCQGVMNSGVARQVREKYPFVYKAYKNFCEEYGSKDTSYLLGAYQIVSKYEVKEHMTPHKDKFICNLFAQDKYGYNGKQYTDMYALKRSLNGLHFFIKQHKSDINKIAFPFMMSCVRGGANWDRVYALIEEIFTDVDVEIWKYDKG